ncbi:MAG: hypothetical protein ACOYLB_13315 [Phototrophicaceae bacterium]
MMPYWFIVIFLTVTLGLIAIGILIELRPRGLNAFTPAQAITRHFQRWARQHPNPVLAWIETICWLCFLIPLVDHFLHTEQGFTAQMAWYLTIGIHEVGHVICIPFGRFLMVLGGSFWQIAFWLGLGVYALFLRKHLVQFLLFWTVAAHSFLNVSVYIRDAQARELKLLFGLDQDAHDWGNLLTWMGLLEYADWIANGAVAVGVTLGLAMVALAVWVTWALPRYGRTPRFEGNLWMALHATLED